MGTLITTVLAVGTTLLVVAGLFTMANLAIDRLPQRAEDGIRPWLFVGPAMVFLFVVLIVPAVRTIFLSFRQGDRGAEGFTLSNWTETLQNKRVISFANAGDILTSRVFLLGVAAALLAVLFAARAGRRQAGRGVDFTAPTSVVLGAAGLIAVLLAVFSTLRGIVWNNLWWVAVVAGLATVLGLALAVLADRSRNETTAKTFIFMPMAISLVGAAVIWKFIYDTPGAGQTQGLLNIVWPGDPIDFMRGTTRTGTIAPWNNFFIMVIMIWVQTGFAMVVLSAAVKGVPAELHEAARVDGATEPQIFWNVTLPQIVPTIVVVVTTLTITVLKIFDLVKATTGGAAGTDVLANRMFEDLRNGNFTSSSTFATMILVLVLPVMYLNVRREVTRR